MVNPSVEAEMVIREMCLGFSHDGLRLLLLGFKPICFICLRLFWLAAGLVVFGPWILVRMLGLAFIYLKSIDEKKKETYTICYLTHTIFTYRKTGIFILSYISRLI